jgi:hypothetical protein
MEDGVWHVAARSDRIMVKKKKRPERANEMPASAGMLYNVRDELKSDVSSLSRKMDTRFAATDSKLDAMNSKIHQALLLVEEQNARNRIVFDGLTSLFTRQERTEARVDALEKNQAFFKRIQKP